MKMLTFCAAVYLTAMDSCSSRVEASIETGIGMIDPRPYAEVDPNLQPRSGPVTFSKDGKRYAYVGRLGEDWVLMVDNKEIVRIPPASTAGATGGIAGTVGNELRMAWTEST